jgi:energy-converting hydrogenase Eha subunit C
MLRNLTLTSIFWIFLGLVLAATGGYYYAYKWRMYQFGVELGVLSIGVILCGMTNGFTDYSPTGRLFSKIGTISFLIGLPLVIYRIYKFI